MSLFTSSFLTAIAAGVLTVGALYFNHQKRTREAAHLRVENGRLRLEAAKRHHAPGAPSAVRVSDSTVSAEPPFPPPATRETLPTESDYRNEGQASPLATLQTFAWACDRGDTETIRKLLCFEEAGRVKAEGFMATLPPDARARWSSPEAMAAELLAHQGMQQPFPAATILERAVAEPVPDGRVTLRLPGTPKDGTVYQKLGDRWHYVITEAAVDRYLADAARRSAVAR